MTQHSPAPRQQLRFRNSPLRSLAILLIGSLTASPSMAAEGLPNIVLCLADDQGWADAGYRGHPVLKTPHLDQMARDGMRFERFYAAAPVCSPTRGSCLTGRHPSRYGIGGANEGHLPPGEITLAEVLRARGYVTGHFGKWHLGTLTTRLTDSNRGRPGATRHFAPPWEHGFDVCFSTEAKVPTWNPMVVPDEGEAASPDEKEPRVGDAYGTRYWLGPGQFATQNLTGDDSRIIMDRVLAFLGDAADRGRPFLAVVWFHAPHRPVVAGPAHREPYANQDPVRQHYYGCLTALDEQIGRLRRRLEEMGVAQQTLVWYASDNGPEGRSQAAPGRTGGLRGRKRSLYEGGIRVPGIAVWPARIPAGEVVSVPCSTSDYFPTICEAVGVDLCEEFPSRSARDAGTLSNAISPDRKRPYDGISLMPLFSGEMARRPRPILFDFKGRQCLVGNRFKLIQSDNGGRHELYDLINDPSESEDVAGSHPEIVARKRRLLDAWHDSCRRSAAGQDDTASPQPGSGRLE